MTLFDLAKAIWRGLVGPWTGHGEDKSPAPPRVVCQRIVDFDDSFEACLTCGLPDDEHTPRCEFDNLGEDPNICDACGLEKDHPSHEESAS